MLRLVMKSKIVSAGGGGLLLAFILGGGPALAEPVDFLRDVRPILSSHCFTCHGPDSAERKSKLRLDLRDDALKPAKSGEPAIIPGRPDESQLVHRIFTEDEDDMMPPPAKKNPLTAGQKEILKQWIADGAEYKPHWAFVKPEEPALPNVALEQWPRNTIDRFILARLESDHLTPSEPADKYTLVRRVYLDLIGLPPTPEQADRFVNNDSPDAYEKLVDELLASNHYGERWARRWLDLARYADTNGYEKDRPRTMWAYRDWVINAYNAGMPFDQFTIEQIAGDLLPNATVEQKVATGFNRNTMINEEGGADPQEYRFYSMVDRVHVTATTWLGLTMACAQCHTHKYDPILHDEYYQFMAFLNNVDEPVMDVPVAELTRKRQEQLKHIARLESELLNKFPPRLAADWTTPAVATFESDAGSKFDRLSDGSFLLEGDVPDKDNYTVQLETRQAGITHVQLQVLPDGSLTSNGPGRSDSGNFVLSGIEVTAAAMEGDLEPKAVEIKRARADFAQNDFPAWNVLDGKDNTGWGVSGDGNWHVARTLTLELAEPVGFEQGTRFTVRLKQQYGKKHVVGRFRLSLGSELPDERPLYERQRENLDYRLARWLDHEVNQTVNWRPLTPVRVKGSFPTLTLEPDNVVFVSGDYTKSDMYTVDFNGDWKGVTAIQVEVLPDDRLPNGGPGRVAYEGPFGDFFMSDTKVFRGEDQKKFKSASDSFRSGGNDAAKAIDDDLQSGWSISGGQGRSHNAVFVFEQPLDFEGDLRLQMIFERYYASGLGKFRVWVTRDADPRATSTPDAVRESLLALKGDPTETERVAHMNRLRSYYVSSADELAEELDEIARLKNRVPDYSTTLVMQERPTGHLRPTHVHKRGEFMQPQNEVNPGVPSFLPDLPAGAPRNRLSFARWLVSPENPLTPRVVMNRNWQAFFGLGLVETMEDFGYQGKLPSHPELLDWLAVEFVKRGWSMKEMQKLIVMSATYQQSSHVTPDRLERDPRNVLLSRGPRFRMEAELVRDSGLVASGLISEKIGGPSVYPPQLASITTEGAYGQLSWNISNGADRYRRGLYTFAKRTAPFAMFNTFDAPSGEACVARRDRSNTPLQSLTLLNDEMFLEMARTLGREAAGSDGSTQSRAIQIFRSCLTRPPSDDELQKLVSFYEKQMERFGSGDLNAADLMGETEGDNMNQQAAWTAVARVLMNLDETVTKS